MGKNLQKIQDMVDGKFSGYKTQVGFTPDIVNRKLGDIWEDHDGVKWEQKNGYRMKIGNMPNAGIFSNRCLDCKKSCKTSYDKDTWNRMERCYHCQINFEVDMKGRGVWRYWIRLQELNNMDIIEKELEEMLFVRSVDRNTKLFDMSVANALANENIDSTVLGNRRK